MSLQNKKALVTGAGGFIGSHLVENLVNQGALVRAFVKYNSRSDIGMLADTPLEMQKNVELFSGDIRDPFFVRKAVKGCDYVFHLAALIGIPYSYIAPNDYVAVNVQGTLNILQACLDENIAHVIHTSTSETYGTGQYVPIDEKHPLQGQSPYSASKIGADKMAEAYYRSFSLPVTIVRPFNTFGPRQSSRAFIPTVISQILTRDELHVGSLEPVRDMTFVYDTVEGFIEIGLCDEAIGKVINLGTGIGKNIGEFIEIILKIINKVGMPIVQEPDRFRPVKSEVMRLICDNSLAKKITGWQPKYDLIQGLTILYFRQKNKLFVMDISQRFDINCYKRIQVILYKEQIYFLYISHIPFYYIVNDELV